MTLIVVESKGWILAVVPPEHYSFNIALIYLIAASASYAVGSSFFKALEQTQAALDTIHAKTASQARLASLGVMSAGVAHEINNPLSIILGNISLLKKVRLDEERFLLKLEALEKASTRTERIVALRGNQWVEN